MPKYTTPIDYMIYDREVARLYNQSNMWIHRVLVSLCWITGARTSEIIDIKRSDVDWNDDIIGIKIKTLKLRDDGKFKIKDRILRFRRGRKPRNIYIETIIKHCEKIDNPDMKILPFGQRWVTKWLNIIGKDALNKPITPYHFRHSVCTAMAMSGFTIPEIMYFKGAISLQGVTAYIHAKPFMVELQNLNRSGDYILQTSGGAMIQTETKEVKEYLDLFK